MSQCLVTGCEGFIGSYLSDFLHSMGQEVVGTVRHRSRYPERLKDKANILECDVADEKAIQEVILKTKPDVIFHLAAQSLVIPSWQDPEQTLKTNILGTLYILEAARRIGTNPVVEVACSSAEYGLSYQSEIPITETKEFRPSSPYAVSKIGADMLAYTYAHAQGMRIIRVRFFNITGPGKTQDACSDFAKGIVEVEKGQKQFLSVGNLDGVRDITDVRDAVHAMWLLTKKGILGEAYNVCSGKGYNMKDILGKLLSLSEHQIEIRQDITKMRPSDDPIFIGDNSKIRQLGWKAEIPIEKTLSDILDYWRAKL